VHLQNDSEKKSVERDARQKCKVVSVLKHHTTKKYKDRKKKVHIHSTSATDGGK
jgi:hypothetical protein